MPSARLEAEETEPPLAFFTGGLGFGLGAPAPNSLPAGITDLSGNIERGIKSFDEFVLLTISKHRRNAS
jgi:hypothetical protein